MISAPMADALVAYLHFVGMISIAVCLALEFFSYAPTLDASTAKRILMTDIAYLFAALLSLGTGLARALYFGKGWEFYAANPAFWVKLGLFVTVGLISLVPTMHFMSWISALKRKSAPVISAPQYQRIKSVLLAELMLFLAIPWLGTWIARGIGVAQH
ncbi:MAG: DUF2214 family protein [Bacteriovoracia bacterium]